MLTIIFVNGLSSSNLSSSIPKSNVVIVYFMCESVRTVVFQDFDCSPDCPNIVYNNNISQFNFYNLSVYIYTHIHT